MPFDIAGDLAQSLVCLKSFDCFSVLIVIVS